MEKEQIFGLIRHALTVVGGALVAKGYIEEDLFLEIRDTIDKIKLHKDKSSIINDKKNKCIAPKIRKEDYKINWDDTSLNIHNKIRAFSYKGAYATYLNRRIKFYDTYYSNQLTKQDPGSFSIKNKFLTIATGSGYLQSKYVQIEGAKKITAIDFINSNKETNKFE